MQTIRVLRFAVFVASGVLTVLDGAIGFVATIMPPGPNNDALKAHYLDAIIFVTLLAIMAYVALGLIDHYERNAEKEERRILNRRVAELHEEKFGKGETKSLAASSRYDGKQGGLRQAGLLTAKRMRDFLATDEGQAGDELLKNFWARFPFREYDSLKSRFQIHLPPFSVVSSTEWIPNTPAKIRKLADNIEKEASGIKPDIPL